MATVSGRWLVGTRYRDIIGADDPPGTTPKGDFIVAGPGNDYLIADIGADVFGFLPGDGYDWIDRFTPGEDKIQFDGGLSAASLVIRPESLAGVAGLAIYYAGTAGPDAIFLAGVNALQPGDLEFAALPGRYFDPPVQDFNLDFKSDVVLRNTDGSVQLWTMNGTAIAGSTRLANPGADWTPIASGDFDADWKVDLLLRNQDGTPAVWGMNGTAIASGVTLPNPGPEWDLVGVGHFTDDAAEDYLFRHADGRIALWEAGGVARPIGSLGGTAVVAQPGPDWRVVGTGDLDGDHRTEILLEHTDGSLVRWRMDGAKIQAGSSIGSLPAGATLAGTADVDGNGKDDILLRQADGTVTLWTMNGSTVTGTADVARPGPEWQVVATGDYDGNDKTDILLQDSEGTVVAWLMNGATIAKASIVANPGEDWQVI